MIEPVGMVDSLIPVCGEDSLRRFPFTFIVVKLGVDFTELGLDWTNSSIVRERRTGRLAVTTWPGRCSLGHTGLRTLHLVSLPSTLSSCDCKTTGVDFGTIPPRRNFKIIGTDMEGVFVLRYDPELDDVI